MLKRLFRSPAITGALFALAVGLLLVGSIGAVQAAPRIVSSDYRAQVELTDIQTGLVENGTQVPDGGELLTNLVPSGDTFKIGKSYDEQLAVTNTGNIDEYVRVTVYTWWEDKEGKAVDLNPDLIDIEWDTDGGWSIDTAASTPERTVLYYANTIAPGKTTNKFSKTLTIKSGVISSVTKQQDGENSFDYEGVTFHVKAVADAVQTHNGQDAMTSAWGRTV